MAKKTKNKKVQTVAILSAIALIVTITGFSLKDILFGCKNNNGETPQIHNTGDGAVIINGDKNIVGDKNISIDSSKIDNSVINTGTINNK